MEYADYDVIDFVLDENFKQWVIVSNYDKFWSAWINKNPQKLSVISQARQMILMINFKTDHPEIHDFNTIWDGIIEGIDISE